MLPVSEILETLLYKEITVDFLRDTQDIDSVSLAELVRALRPHAHVPLSLRNSVEGSSEKIIDVCGTGGSQSRKPNASTLLAFFAPSLGIRVCKHGGKSRSGQVGSLDFLQELQFEPLRLFSESADHLRAFQLCFLPVAFTYPFFARSVQARTQWGKASLFNLLGPLLTPVTLQGRLLGASRPEHAQLLAHTLLHLQEPGCVVCGEDAEGYVDEPLPWGRTHAFFVGKTSLQNHSWGVFSHASAVSSAAGGHGTVFSVTLPPLGQSPLASEKNSVPLWFADKSFRRSEIFAQAKTVSLSLLQNKSLDFIEQGPSEKALLAMIFMGMSLASVVIDTLWDNADFESKVNEQIQSHIWQLIAASKALQESAQQRFKSLVNYVPVHHRSPTLRPSCAHDVLLSDPHVQQPVVQQASPKSVDSLYWPRGGGLIAEIKLCSPGKTHELGAPEPELSQRIQAYSKAHALSVVTHPDFGGSLQLLRYVRQHTQKPILAKDFVKTPQEVRALAQAGASAVLLLRDFLDSSTLHALAQEAAQCGVHAVIESTWHIPQEETSLWNARNLFSLEVGRSHRDSVYFDSVRRGGARGLVLASAFSDSLEVRSLLLSGANVLVGSALMGLKNMSEIQKFMDECLNPSPLFKVCGAGGWADVEDALAHGADLVGINFIPSSKRYMPFSVLKPLLPKLQQVARHLVFLTHVTTPPEIVAAIQSIHGYEQPYSRPLLVRSRGLLAPWGKRHQAHVRWGILEQGLPGSGKTTPYPASDGAWAGLPMLCAGGVQASNVALRLNEARQCGHKVVGVDVATGVQKLLERPGQRETSAQVSSGLSEPCRRFDPKLIQDISHILMEQSHALRNAH